MLAALLQRLKGELALALVRTFVARGIAAVGGVLLFVVLGRLYGAEGIGVFALAQSIYFGAGILARYGMDNALMRYVGQDPSSAAVGTYLRWAVTRSAVLSTITAVPIYLLSGNFSDWFQAPMVGLVLPGVAIAIPPFTVAFVLGGFMKGIRRPATACLLENGSIALFACGFVLVLNTIWPVGIANAGWAMALAAWVVFGHGIFQVLRWLKRHEMQRTTQPIPRHAFNSSSGAFFVMSLAQFMQQTLAIMIAGWLLNSVDLGLFKAAERVALLISFVLLVINAVLPPRFASFHLKGDLEGLGVLARKGAIIGLVLASPLLILCFVFPHLILGLFGAEFIEAASLLRIIAVAQVVNVVTGSVGFLLNMTGHERLMRNIALCCNGFGLAAFLILIPMFGAMGAAVAFSLVIVLQNVTSLVLAWRELGVWIMPFPNFVKHFGVKDNSIKDGVS